MNKVVITGGAGFIGINAANFFLNKGWYVTILDNFSRKGSIKNAQWLKKNNSLITVVKGDVRNYNKTLRKAFEKANLVLHLAGQVAVTTSVINPRVDFESNALGTFNVLEAVRNSNSNPVLIYSSTNKVYGGLENLTVGETKSRYVLKSYPNGISESQNIDFHSPYGCSKGAADQYVRDYSRIYGLKTIVMRQSCIYGPHQFGIEDQGWVAWFLIALTLNKKINIYGNGKQVRDLLYIDDLIRAYYLAYQEIKKTAGEIYNVGGGIKNSLSIWREFKPILENLFKREIPVEIKDWRPGDQYIYISDIRKAKEDFEWEPKVNIEKGIKKLYDWISENKKSFYEYFNS